MALFTITLYISITYNYSIRPLFNICDGRCSMHHICLIGLLSYSRTKLLFCVSEGNISKVCLKAQDRTPPIYITLLARVGQIKLAQLFQKPRNLGNENFFKIKVDLNKKNQKKSFTAPTTPRHLLKLLFFFIIGYLLSSHPLYNRENKKNPFPKDRSDAAVINVLVRVGSNETRLTLETDESYELEIAQDKQEVTYFL